MAYTVGSIVQAAERVTEAGFNGEKSFCHARRGDLGRVQAVDGAWLTVTWSGGTTTDCHEAELRRPLTDGRVRDGI